MRLSIAKPSLCKQVKHECLIYFGHLFTAKEIILQYIKLNKSSIEPQGIS